ncbi:hypothetical protein AB0J83_29375 [Actinoplanes sp. NPDC049596]|uniref:hypothetical protein n=1 Tax=unclassified Actinoplanes TaxID=2626549 RepID=UPI00343B6724
MLGEPGRGRVLVVDGHGSVHRALLGCSSVSASCAPAPRWSRTTTGSSFSSGP